MALMTTLAWRLLPVAVVLLVAGVAHAKYDFDNAFFNQQLLDQVDDALRPWRSEKDEGQERRQRPRFRHKDGVLVARWYPALRGEPPQYQWSWEVPTGVNQSAKLWWRPYYPQYYQPYRRYYCGYRGYYRYCYGRGYGGYRRNGYRNGYGGYYGGERGYRRGRDGYRGNVGGYGSGMGFGGGFSGYASWSGGPAFDRIVVNSKPKARQSAAPGDVPSRQGSSSRPPPLSTTAPPGGGDDPNADVEQVHISNNIENLPTATEEMLGAVDQHPGHIPFQEQVCCGRYEEVSLMQQDAIREQCYLEVFNGSRLWSDEAWNWDHLSCHAVQNVKHNIQCVHQCLWKLRGTLDNGGKVSILKLREHFRGSDSQQWRIDVVEQAARKCMPEYDAMTDHTDGIGNCPRRYLDLSFCIWKELQDSCPDDEWNSKSQYCNKMRTYIRARRRSSS